MSRWRGEEPIYQWSILQSLEWSARDLDLSAEEIACRYDLLHSQWDALGLTSTVVAETVLNTVQEKSVVNNETRMIDNLEQLYA